MEPAVKPAVENTCTGVVGVLATPATFQGALYASVVERFADNVTLLQNTCPGLVQQIERGKLDGSKTRSILESALHPMMNRGIDTVVLGCTHFPFVIPIIQEIVGPDVRVIDPAPSVARQVIRLLDSDGMLAESSNSETPLFYTSGNVTRLKALLPRLFDEAGNIKKVFWENNEIHLT
jgi:glutamate racemase